MKRAAMNRNSCASPSAGALEGIRVLEIAGAAVQYCGKMFADLGADVILVEPPAGASTRGAAPFFDGPLDDNGQAVRSLPFVYLNTGKRSVTLDLQTAEGRASLHRLAADADLVIEGCRPGELAAAGCGYEDLSAPNPALVMTSITPYGQTGPYSSHEAEDLVCMATGGFLYLGGYPDTPPIGAYGNQAHLCGSMFGAVASMLALTRAETTGQGDHVDVSIQECMVLAMENAVQFYELEGTLRRRTAGLQRFAGTGVYACADGYVYMMAGGIGANRFWDRTIEWLKEEGVPSVERLYGDAWSKTSYLQSDEATRIFMEVFGAWANKKTKAYLYAAAQDRHVPAAAINAVDDLVASPQLAARQYFVELNQPGWPRTARVPGPPYQFTQTPWALRRPAPFPGQHNDEVFEALKNGPQRRHDKEEIQ
jgi:benzylsuccinate CoA-transferase BbsE subunit